MAAMLSSTPSATAASSTGSKTSGFTSSKRPAHPPAAAPGASAATVLRLGRQVAMGSGAAAFTRHWLPCTKDRPSTSSAKASDRAREATWRAAASSADICTPPWRMTRAPEAPQALLFTIFRAWPWMKDTASTDEGTEVEVENPKTHVYPFVQK